MKYLVRFSSELSLKSTPVRRRFVQMLTTNMARVFAESSINASIDNQWYRLLVEVDDAHADQTQLILGRFFGISSFSPLVGTCRPVLAEIIETGMRLFKGQVIGKTYAVDARRAGTHAFTSLDVNQQLGGALRPYALKVNIVDPQLWIGVEVRQDQVCFFSQKISGAGGLPVSSGGRALCLLSGGFDSVVAAWMMLKRGIMVDYVYFNLVGGGVEKEVVAIAQQLIALWGNGRKAVFYNVDFVPIADMLRKEVKEAYVQVELKRMFYRGAEKIARELHYEALVTGEALAQVSSQTLANLGAIDEAVSILVLRPLITFDKQEIIDLSKKIGVYEMCAKVKEYCQLVPDRPSTRARVEILRGEEQRLDMSMLQRQIDSMTYLPLTSKIDAPLPPAVEMLFVETILPRHSVIDLRTENEFKLKTLPNAIHCSLDDVLTMKVPFDTDKSYVFACSLGMQSAVAAQFLRTQGYKAYALKKLVL